MRIISISALLLLLTFFLIPTSLSAQANIYLTSVKVDKDSLAFSTSRGSLSKPDTLTLSGGRYGGRFHVYFEGNQAGYFRFVGRVWKKVKRYHEIKLALVFSPPDSFKGVARAKLRIKGISLYTWAL